MYKRFVLITLITVVVLGLLAFSVAAADGGGTDYESVDDAEPGVSNPSPLTEFEWLEAVLWDNGPLVNCVGCGVGGADESVLQSISLGMGVLGFGHQVLNGNWIADDFTVGDPAGWTVDSVTFFAYQTNAGPPSTMTNVNWMLFDGQPGAGGTMIANGSGLFDTDWTNIYRVTEDTTGGNTARPIMYDTVDMGGMSLPAGDYWIAWQTDGTAASGPWAPPITINGQTTTGNGLQSTDNGGTWNPALDSGSQTQQGFPFVIEGTVTIPASLVMTKTVGTDPAVCATTDEIAVVEGTDVYYCYQMENTGDVTLTYHTVTDSELGVLLGPDFVANVGPGSVVYFTETTSIMMTTVNTATWDVRDDQGGTIIATDSDTATVNVVSPSIEMTKTVGTDPAECAMTDVLVVGQPSTEVYYCYTVNNTGDVTMPVHSLVDDMLGTLLDGEPYDLGPGESFSLFPVTATITSTITNVATWTASIPGGPSVMATASATVTEQPTDVNLSSFGSEAAAVTWPAVALALVVLFFGAVLIWRRQIDT